MIVQITARIKRLFTRKALVIKVVDGSKFLPHQIITVSNTNTSTALKIVDADLSTIKIEGNHFYRDWLDVIIYKHPGLFHIKKNAGEQLRRK